LAEGFSHCRQCGRQIIWVDEAGKKRPYDLVPDGRGGWKAGASHFQSCPAERLRREKKACVLCRLAQSENPFDLILETDFGNLRFCVEDAARGERYIRSLHRTVKASAEELLELRREARRWKRRTQRLAEAAEGTARLDVFG